MKKVILIVVLVLIIPCYCFAVVDDYKILGSQLEYPKEYVTLNKLQKRYLSKIESIYNKIIQIIWKNNRSIDAGIYDRNDYEINEAIIDQLIIDADNINIDVLKFYNGELPKQFSIVWDGMEAKYSEEYIKGLNTTTKLLRAFFR